MKYMIDANNIMILKEINNWSLFLKTIDLRKDEDIKTYNRGIKTIKNYANMLKEVTNDK